MRLSLSHVLAASVIGLLNLLRQEKAEVYTARLVAALKNAQFLRQNYRVETDLGALYFQGADSKNIGHLLETEKRYKKDSFFQHDVEVRYWIRDNVKENQVLWDIGANMGWFSLYAALKQGVRVHAFEPYVPVLMELTQNIHLNRCHDRVRAYGVAIGLKTSMERLRLHEIIAMQGQGWRGIDQKRTKAPEHSDLIPSDDQTLGFFDIPSVTMDDACRVFGIEQPHHIKIDIDGLEVEVLTAKTQQVLSQVQSLMVEVEYEDRQRLQAELAPYLKTCGLIEKTDPSEEDEGYIKNRLFVRA